MNNKIIRIFILVLIVITILPVTNALNNDIIEIQNCKNHKSMPLLGMKGIYFVKGENFSYNGSDLRYYYFLMENVTIQGFFGIGGSFYRWHINQTEFKALKPKIKITNPLSGNTRIICRWCDFSDLDP